MVHVILYTKPACPYCDRAKALLKQKGVAIAEEIDVTASLERKDEMIAKSGGRLTVPQIFIDGQHIGGCDDLYALEKQGKLDPLLRQSA